MRNSCILLTSFMAVNRVRQQEQTVTAHTYAKMKQRHVTLVDFYNCTEVWKEKLDDYTKSIIYRDVLKLIN